jgi:hypothetical protein
MAKILIDCADPNDLAAINEAAEQAAGKCNVTYYNQHEAMVEAGLSSSQRESARIIAEEAGDSEEAVRKRIERGKKHWDNMSRLQEPTRKPTGPIVKNVATYQLRKPGNTMMRPAKTNGFPLIMGFVIGAEKKNWLKRGPFKLKQKWTWP